MGKSFRHEPFHAFTTSSSDKAFKRSEHRRERAAVRDALASGRDIPDSKKFGDPWSSSKDGKARFDPDRFPNLMRK